MTALTLADMSTAFRALDAVTEAHPELPYATFHVRGTTLVAEQVIDVQLDTNANEAFAAWVAAFELTDDQLSTRPRTGGFGFSTTGVTRYAGVTWVIYLTHLNQAWRPVAEAVAA